MILYNWKNLQEQSFLRRYRDLDKEILGQDVFERLAELLPAEELEIDDIISPFAEIATEAWHCPRLPARLMTKEDGRNVSGSSARQIW